MLSLFFKPARKIAVVAVLGSLSASAQNIATLAGNPPALTNGAGLGQFIESSSGRPATDSAGNVYIAVTVANRVVKINPTSGVLTIVAGTGTPGFSGDNGPATSAQLSFPIDVAVDAVGNVYIADQRNNRIRRINTSGVISTVAGNGTSGFSGDGGQATAATMRQPEGVAVDAAGSLYISDDNNNRIRKVTTGGIISTIAGTGTAGFTGDGGPATAAQINNPRTVAVDAAGNVCFADQSNHRVRCFAQGGNINTVAGTGTAGFSGDSGPANAAQLSSPNGVAFDAQGNIYIADINNHRIRKITKTTSVITTVAGTGSSSYSGDGGAATSARISSPYGVALDASGNLYLTDDNYLLRRVTAAGVISSIAGRIRFGGDGGNALNSLLSNPNGLARDSNGNIYVTDSGNNRVRKIDTIGTITTFAGTGSANSTGDGGQAAAAALNSPVGIFIDPGNNIYITESNGHRVRRISAAGIITTVAGTGTATSTGDGGPATSATLNGPLAVALDAAGNLYVSENGGHRVRKIATNGTITTLAGTGTAGFSGDGGPAVSAQLNNPRGLAVDTQGNVYIADRSNHVVRKVDLAGNISRFAGTGTAGFAGDGGPATAAQLNSPYRVTIDGSGNFWIPDTSNNRIRFISPATGIIATAAGNGNAEFLGDGGLALNAALRFPTDVLLFGDGRMFIADNGNDRVRQVAIGTPVTVTFQTSPTGRRVTIDNVDYTAPLARVWAQGSSHSVTVPSQTITTNVERYVFASWADTGSTTAARTIVANATATYTANLAQQFFLTSQVSPSGSGTVTSGYFNAGTQASVQATPNSGYQFASFAGALTGSANPQSLLMDGAKSVTGNFTFAGTAGGRRFITVTPCRIADTRNPNGAFGGPSLAANTSRSFTIPQAACNIPANAAAYSLNVTVVPKEPLGFLTIFPTGSAQPFVSTLNSLDARIKANAALVGAGTGGAVTVFVNNATEVILDINGYFVDPAVNGNGLSFYPVTPCRVSDTRNANGTLGGPIIPAGGSRDIPVRSSNCGIPTTAVAYSVNATVVPPAALGFLTLWPAGQTQPGVSTLNAPTGAITANAAIVPAGTNGAISAFMSSASHLVLDINGYFAPPGAANAQSFFSVAPCRLLDTRNAAGEFGGPILAASTPRSYRLPLGGCGLPATATAFSVNATVVPTASLGFLTLWPTGAAQPFVSTLNALDGAITANAAIVPAGTAGAVSSIVTDQSHLILDTNGYFAP